MRATRPAHCLVLDFIFLIFFRNKNNKDPLNNNNNNNNEIPNNKKLRHSYRYIQFNLFKNTKPQFTCKSNMATEHVAVT
jgi:hypothetical protein